MDIDMPLVLTWAVAISGGIWLLDVLLLKPRRAAAAEALLSSHLELWRGALRNSWLVAYAESALGASLTALERYVEAEELLLRSYPRIRDAQGDASPKTQVARRRLAELYAAWGRPERAREYMPPPGD